ncbi:MAG: hypothetical protein IPG53_23570 [Ignavibacteriales bacterium]|nr:hypothetical protein [Ignavibacteriales bacterium]
MNSNKTRSLIEIEKAISKIESEIGRFSASKFARDRDVQSELMSRKVEEQYISGKGELLNKNAPTFWGSLNSGAEGAGTLFQPLLGIADSFINAATLLYLKNAGSFPVLYLIYSFLLVLFLIYTIKCSGNTICR